MKAVKASVPKGRRSLLQASFRACAAPGGPPWKEAENRRSERKVRVRLASDKNGKVSEKVKGNDRIKPEDKLKALETALTQIKKQFGEGAVMRLGQNNTLQVEAIPTGSLSLDLALGIGGLPRGRIVEIYGPESSGKTTLALHCVAEGQKMGGNAAFIDVEHALDPVYAAALGVDVDSLLVSQPDTGEQALEITEALVRSNAIDVIVVDSVAALVPRAEIEGEMGDSHVGLQARLMSQALRKLAGAISKSNCVAIFINQLREKVGVVYGNPEVTPGGRALKFYSSVRIDVRKKEVIKNGTDIIGSHTKVKVVKNKVAPPFREVEFDIMYGQGISRVGELLDLAEKLDIVQKSGAWFSYNGTRIGQGRENAKKFLQDNPDIFEEITERVKQNADKLYLKTAKGEGKPVVSPVETAPMPEEKPVDSRKVKADIDITVDDDE